MTEPDDKIDPRPIRILLVDDNPLDARLTKEGFERARLLVELEHVDNGRDCLAYLRKEGPYENARRPDLILLDLSMPEMDGREVMAEIERDENLKQIPVIVLTTSHTEKDVEDMYRLGCSSYITKPIDFDRFLEVVRGIGDYWLSIAVLPPNEESARGPAAFLD